MKKGYLIKFSEQESRRELWEIARNEEPRKEIHMSGISKTSEAHNAPILDRMRGVPATPATVESDPTNPNKPQEEYPFESVKLHKPSAYTQGWNDGIAEAISVCKNVGTEFATRVACCLEPSKRR